MRHQHPARALSVASTDIISAAEEIFRTHSYHSVTMEQIHRAAGVSKATLYFYFANKEDLFLAVARKARQRLYDDLVATMPKRSPYAMIVNGNTIWLRAMIREGRILSEFQILGLTESGIAAAWEETFIPFNRDMEAWLKRRIAEGSAPPQNSKLAVLQFFNMIQYTTYQYFRRGIPLGLDSITISDLLQSLSQSWYRMVFARTEPEDFDYEPYVQLIMSASDNPRNQLLASSFDQPE